MVRYVHASNILDSQTNIYIVLQATKKGLRCMYIFYFHIRLSILMCITRFILAHQNPSTNNYPQALYIVGLFFFSSVLSDLFRFATFFWDNHQQGLKPPTRKPCLFLQDDDFHYNVSDSDSFSVGVGSTTN